MVVAHVPSWLKFSYLSELLVSTPPSTVICIVVDDFHRRRRSLIFHTSSRKAI